MTRWTQAFLIAAVLAASTACHAASQEAPAPTSSRALPPPPVAVEAPDAVSIPLLPDTEDKAQWEDFLDQLAKQD